MIKQQLIKESILKVLDRLKSIQVEATYKSISNCLPKLTTAQVYHVCNTLEEEGTIKVTRTPGKPGGRMQENKIEKV